MNPRPPSEEDLQEQSLGLPYPGAPRLVAPDESGGSSTGQNALLTAARLGLPNDPEQSLQPERTISTVQRIGSTLLSGVFEDAEETLDSSKFMLGGSLGDDDVTIGSSQAGIRMPTGADATVPYVDGVAPIQYQDPSGPKPGSEMPSGSSANRIKKATTPSGPLIMREFLASGGFGEVWTGDQVSLGRTIAVKRIRDALLQELPDPAMQAGIEDMFRAEACITASLEHPNIVPVYDIGRDENGRPVLAMKLVRGETWRDILRREYWEMTPSEFLMKHVPILVQVGQAVAFAHGLSVVHRDLKPSQVMLGDYGEVLLMDWGLAMRIDREAPPPPLPTKLKPANRRSGLSGTLAYMAPEQAVGETALIGPWTDTFLLGAILYELLTGGPPYKAPTSLEVLNLATAGQVEPPSSRALPRAVPRELEAIALKAMARNPADRYASVRDFVSALQDWMTGAGRRRESVELAQKAMETLSTAGRSYAFITVAISQLTNAQVLWNENPEIQGLLNKAHTQFAMAAIDNGDLVLARLQAGLVEESTVRAGLLAKVELAARAARAKAQQRVHLLAVVGLLVVAIVGGVIYFSADQVRAARELQTSNSRMQLQMEKAALTREQAEELLTFMLEDLRPQLEPTGQIFLLDGIGKQALRYFDTLDWEQSTTRGLQRQILALNQVALVQQAQGNLPFALETAQDAVSKADQLTSMAPNPTMAMRTAAGAAYSLRGMIQAQQGADAAAASDLTMAGDILQRALVVSPLDPQVRLEYAQALNRQAMMATRLGALDRATELNSQALPLVQPPTAVPTTSWPPATLRTSALILTDLGSGHAVMGNLVRAQADLTLAADYLKDALRREPEYDLWRMDLWRILDQLGRIQLERGEVDNAQETFAAALTTIELLTTRDGSKPQWAAARALALARMGAVPSQMGRWSDARTFLDRARIAAEGLSGPTGAIPEGRDELAAVRSNLSRVMRRLGRMDEAQTLAASALSARETAYQADTGSLEKLTEVVRARLVLAEANLAGGITSGALTMARKAQDEATSLTLRTPLSVHARILAAQAELLTGDAHRSMGQGEAADLTALRALDILQYGQREMGNQQGTSLLAVAVRALNILGKTDSAAPLREMLTSRGLEPGWLEPIVPKPSP